MGESTSMAAEQAARHRARYLTGLIWHIGAFVIINAFFWLMDLALGRSGIQWAYWITALWAFALLFHALAWFVDGRRMEDRKTGQYLEEDGHLVR